MAQGWWKENWEDIKYAHKSVWVSMGVFLLLGCYGTWYAAGVYNSRQLDIKDATIAQLNAQLQQLQKTNDKLKVKRSSKEEEQEPSGYIPPHSTDSPLDQLEKTKEQIHNELYQQGVVGNR